MKYLRLLALLLGLVLFPGVVPATPARLSFVGGPDGGTFQYFSNGIATRLNRQRPATFQVVHLPSAGSVENIRRVNSGDADFGIAYSGDTWLARQGKLSDDPKPYRNIRAVAFLYGAPAHLVVPADSTIRSVEDLAGHSIAVGATGSGAATAARRYFSVLGLWSKLRVKMIGYNRAAQALAAGQVDAMWAFAGFPNASITQLAAKMPIRLLDTWPAGRKQGLDRVFPFYTPVTIPAGTYAGVDTEIKTFQDAAIWIAGKHLDADLVRQALEEIFSPEGLTFMVRVKKTAKEMSIGSGLTGIVIPVHPGAAAFWRSKGLKAIPVE
ncbi:hypothetical protein EDC39_1183 [Geothermobacter ehrlichii]|uniref:TRAP transporter TAXI family solute receptor n=1 Tax=Geothermobacter ehrlichii TaxID=213224 RepID=A0A5D3WEH6_9BACT|nr:TAXI family TRAP transporter solute-binding subunit [Geothermobacter ehrlichii]TYO95665.1 hypothetical protein EDC39_1183 [Geothermobacter ehrlichii]